MMEEKDKCTSECPCGCQEGNDCTCDCDECSCECDCEDCNCEE